MKRLLALAGAFSLFVLLAIPAYAGASPVPAAFSTPMRLDCASMSATARSYAVSHGYCPVGPSTGVVPRNKVYGNCGDSWLTILNRGNGGYPYFNFGADSSQGNIVLAHWSINWENDSWFFTGNDSGQQAMFTSNWSRYDVVNTFTGYVFASMSGWVVLWWGGVCTFNNPHDYKYIT